MKELTNEGVSELMKKLTRNITIKESLPNTTATGGTSERLPWLDFASGVMILWMIVFHALSTAWGYECRNYWGVTDPTMFPDNLHAFINDNGRLVITNPCVLFPYLHFFMPWFFYKSGQFFKKKSGRELWQKDSRKLLTNFVIWSAIGYIFFLILGMLDDSLTLRGATYTVIRRLFLRGYIPINQPLWFLVTLFGVRMIANWILPQRDDKYTVLRIIGLILLGYVISYLAYRYNHRLLPYWVANGAAGLSFFTFGYAMRDWEQKSWIVVPCLMVYVVGCIVGFPIVDMMGNHCLAGNYLLWIPVAFCCIIFFNALCKWLTVILRFKLIEWIGRNSMIIYIVHALIFVSIYEIVIHYFCPMSGQLLLYLILLAYVVILPICCILYSTIRLKFK